MLNHSPGIASAIAACGLTLALIPCNVPPVSPMSTVGYSLVASDCTSRQISGALTGIYTVCPDSGTHRSLQNLSKIVVLDVYPASGSPQIGPASGGEQTLSSAIGRRVAASLHYPSRGTRLFPGQNVGITNNSSTDSVDIVIDSAGTIEFDAASYLAHAIENRVGGQSLNELVDTVQSCVSDVATLFNTLNQPGKQSTVADTISLALTADTSCRDLVKKVREQVQEQGANKETRNDQVQKDLADNVHQYERTMNNGGSPGDRKIKMFEGVKMLEKVRPRRLFW